MVRLKNLQPFALLAIAALLMGSCGSSSLGGLRDVQVSEITLAEPLVAEAKLSEKVKKLRSNPSKKQELAAALAELSLVHNELMKVPEADSEAREAASLIDPRDRTSRTYFLTRRALFYELMNEGKHGAGIITPLLYGKWSDLDKAQLLDDLIGSFARDYSTKEIALKALVLRSNATGPHSLEVAESLCTYANHSWGPGSGMDQALCAKLQLPPEAVRTTSVADEANEHAAMFRRRAALIEEDILGDSSLRLADTLACLGETEQRRAIRIYEKHFGVDSPEVASKYAQLAFLTTEPLNAQEFRKKASIGNGLRQAGNDPFKRTYVYVKGTMPSDQRQNQQDMLTKAFKSFGSNPPDMTDQKVGYGSFGLRLDVNKLAEPKFDELFANVGSSPDTNMFGDRLTLSGFRDKHEVLFMSLPTWGGQNVEVKVTGKGRIKFRQEDQPTFGFQEIEYKWNGKIFEETSGKAGDQDRQVVNSAINDVLNGLGFYGIKGHHSVSHELIEHALAQACASAQDLSKGGDPGDAAVRLRSMFELTSSLVQESSTGVVADPESDELKDDVHKWIRAWTFNGPQCTVNLTAKEWQPFLTMYTELLKKAGQAERAHRVIAASVT